MKLMRTPPVASSADTDAVSNTISCSTGRVRDGAAAPAAADHRAQRDAVHHEALVFGAAAMGPRARVSGPSAPPTFWFASVPPLRDRSDTPGMRTPSSNMLRPVGSVVMASASITRCRVVLCTSTIGRLAGDGDRLFERADAHLGVDGRRERAGQRDAVTLDGVEAGQRERDRVGAGPQLGDAVLPDAVGDGGADLLDDRRAGCLDGDARAARRRTCPSRPR